MKFQVILETTGSDRKRAGMPNDEFEKLMRRVKFPPGFKLVFAQSLDGVRAELWQPTGSGKGIRVSDKNGNIFHNNKFYVDPLE